MARVTFQGAVLAESDDTVEVEGNLYFPKSALKMEYFQPSEMTTVCPWKGTARYYTLVAGGETAVDAAWYYPETSERARNIQDRVAFWVGRGPIVER